MANIDTGSSNSQAFDVSKYAGVKGWLLFLCVALTILSPLRGIVTLVQTYSEMAPLFERYPGLKTLAFIDIPLSVALIALSIHAGLSLWLVRPRAVQIARRLIYISLGYLAISSFLPFTAGLPSEANGAMGAEVAKSIVQGLAFAAIWLLYLSSSKRVRATYPDAASA